MEYTIMDANLLNGLSLAYIGDAIYEVYIREYILSLGYSNVNRLHKKACEFTSGVSQSKFIRYFLDNNILTEEDMHAKYDSSLENIKSLYNFKKVDMKTIYAS